MGERTKNILGSLLTWVLFLGFVALVIHDDRIGATTRSEDINTEFIQHLYGEYNRAYFSNKLPEKVQIGFNEHEDLGSVICDDHGQNCDIEFNLHYTGAPRFAALVMQHEMCHIEQWTTDGPDHGKHWQACMLKLDAMDSNRLVLIDGWYGKDDN